MALMSLGWITAQDKKVDGTKTTVFTADIHCENCSTKILNNVPALGKGIKDVQVNVTEKTVTVTYDANKNSDERIVKGLKSLNVEAAPIALPAEKKTCTKSCCTGDNQPNEQPKGDCCKQE